MGNVTPLPSARAVTLGDRIGVIDVGSNSIRLVVYDALKRAPEPLFNEKVLCAIGKSIASTGELDPAGVALAEITLSRFAGLARAMGVRRLEIVATAAARDARNGPAFVAAIERICEAPVRLLSGEDEARLSALGVLAGVPDAEGLVGDLGGGSLELVPIAGGRIGRGDTLPLGPLRLMDASKGDKDKARKIADDALQSLGWLDLYAGRTLYVVGGAWRAIARIHMEQRRYPLHVLHHYRIPRNEARELARLVAEQSKKSLERIPGVSKRRLDTLPMGALVLDRLLRIAKVEDVTVSATGLREGLLYEALPDSERVKDPLIEAARLMCARLSRFDCHGDELFTFTDPLFVGTESPEERRLRLATSLLADIAWRAHPDYRAEEAMAEILRFPFTGLDHGGRAFIAMASYLRYAGDGDGIPNVPAAHVLKPEALVRARVIGLALRLAQTLSGGTAGVLPDCKLSVSDTRLVLTIGARQKAFMGDVVRRRHQALAASLGRLPEIEMA